MPRIITTLSASYQNHAFQLLFVHVIDFDFIQISYQIKYHVVFRILTCPQKQNTSNQSKQNKWIKIIIILLE